MPKDCHRIVVLTGAGISVESGVPVFRGPDGLWQGRRVEEVATSDAVANDPWGVNCFFNKMRRESVTIKPNAAHRTLAEFERLWPGSFLLVTQNIDALHEQAGSKNLIHMHGELARVFCGFCHADYLTEDDVIKDTPCAHCGTTGHLRPDIVLFGEMPKQMDSIFEALSQCDLFVAIGTSGVVYPAAGFVDVADSARARTVEINPAETERSMAFQEHVQGTAGQAVPAFFKQLLAE